MGELKSRWMKPGRRTREEIIDSLSRRSIIWVKEDKKEDTVQVTKISKDRSWKKEEGGGNSHSKTVRWKGTSGRT